MVKTLEIEGKQYSNIKDIENDFKSFNQKNLKETVDKYVIQILDPEDNILLMVK